MYQLNDFINTRFFLRDTSEDPIRIGSLIKYHKHENSGTHLPIIEIDGKEYLSFSAMLPYSEHMELLLNSLTPTEQWDFMLKINHWHCAHSRKCRSST